MTPPTDACGTSTPMLIRLERVTLRLRERRFLPDTSWEIRLGEQWAVLGPNGSGKTALTGVLVDRTPYAGGRVHRCRPEARADRIGYLSLELHERWLAAAESALTAREFSRGAAPPIRARDLLDDPPGGLAAAAITAELEIRHRMDADLLSLSTGEMRRFLLARAFLASDRLLVLDEPYEGLDPSARRRLRDHIAGLTAGKRQIVLATHRAHLLPESVTHLMLLKDGRVVYAGPRESGPTPEAAARIDNRRPGRIPLPLATAGTRPSATAGVEAAPAVIAMRDLRVCYGRRCVIDRLNWTVRPGEHWAILGPNGSGKTTLLSLIAGDHPQAYANAITLFGRRRGSGESIWDIKSRIGLVSSEFQFRYRRPVPAIAVVCSGYFDSVGLYRPVTRSQKAHAARWLAFVGLSDKAGTPAARLSYGERRLVLLARAMVKSPELLLLDEPCQGLDPANRQMVIDLIHRIGTETPAQVLLVTHHDSDLPGGLFRILRLDGRGGYDCP